METILTEQRGPVVLLRLNRPEKRNAISPQMLQELASALQMAQRDEHIRVVVLTGDERAFSAGADIDAFANTTPEQLMTTHSDLPEWDAIRRFPKPLIAAVAGYVFGGGFELALSCDMIVAAETARFAFPEITIGLIPGAGGTQHIVRRLGLYRAMEVLLTGRELSAQEAFSLGLVTLVVPPEHYLDRALALADHVAQRSPAAVRAVKRAVRLGAEMPLDAALIFERELFHEVFATPAAQEAIQAFLARRRHRQSSA